MTPRLESCYFGQDIYERMALVLEYSARKHLQGWDVNVRKIDPAPLESAWAKPSYLHNTQKMAHWCEVIQSAPDGAEVLLIDSDVMVIESLDSIWARPFDVAMTVKRGPRFPFNSGVVFVRVGDRTRAFVREWMAENAALLADKQLHAKWQVTYGGINQAALGKMREGAVLTRLGIKTLDVPCAEWNCEDASWSSYQKGVTKIVHLKGALRKRVFGSPVTSPAVERLARLWHKLDHERTTALPTLTRDQALLELRALAAGVSDPAELMAKVSTHAGARALQVELAGLGACALMGMTRL